MILVQTKKKLFLGIVECTIAILMSFSVVIEETRSNDGKCIKWNE